MKNFFITIVDVLGIMVPGLLLLIGIFLLPPVTQEVVSSFNTDTSLVRVCQPLEEVMKNPYTLFLFILIISYVAGLLIRFESFIILNAILRSKWKDIRSKRFDNLEKLLEKTLGPALSEAIKGESGTYGKIKTGFSAPFSEFAKRLASRDPIFLPEVQRLEADIRFSAGLFVPFIVLIIDGLLMMVLLSKLFWCGLMLVIFPLLGILIILHTYPNRRVSVVVRTYYMALIVLLLGDLTKGALNND